MTRQMQVSVFLLLLLFLFVQLYGTSRSLAAVTPQCMLDVKMKKNGGTGSSAEVVRELPRKGQRGEQAYTVSTSERKLIRIVTSTKDLENKKKYCSRVRMWIWDFYGEPFLCDKFHVVSDEYIHILKTYVIPGAVKLHADRLLVDRLDTPLVVPEFKEDSVCNYFTVPLSHHCKGVENADMVLYVAAKPVSPFATVCAEHDVSGRPIVVAMNFREHNKFGLRYTVRLAAHELAHALGFDYNLFVKHNMVEKEVKLRGKKRTLVTADSTKRVAREHYDCETLEGLELAFDNRDPTKVVSHWAHRVAKDDLMSSSYSEYGPGYYTALTMSVFDALPYYTANWAMQEPMAWGKNSSCNFISGNCITSGNSNFPKMFCDGTTSRCTSDRFAVGTCETLYKFNGRDELDNCPYAEPVRTQTSETLMTAPCTLMLKNDIPGSVTGNDSWCLDGKALVVKPNKRVRTATKVGGVCARIRCEDDVVKVQYAGDDNWYECHEGQSLKPSETSPSFVSGEIMCPKYSEVCTIGPNGTSLLPLTVPPEDKPEPLPYLPQAALTPLIAPTPTSATNPSKPAPVQGEGPTQPTTGTTDTGHGNTGTHSGTQPSQSEEKSASTESGNKGRQRRDTTNAAVSSNENTDASSSSSSSSLPPSSHSSSGTNAVDSPTTVVNSNKETLPPPKVPGEVDIRMSMDGTPVAACILHVVFLIMAVAFAVPL